MLLFVLRKAPIVGELSLAVGIFAYIAPSMHRHVLGQRATIQPGLKNVQRVSCPTTPHTGQLSVRMCLKGSTLLLLGIV